MRPGPGGLGGVTQELLQVTYANGDVEQFPDVDAAVIGDRNSQTLELLEGRQGRVVAVLVLVNVRKWEWVAHRG